MKKLILLGFFCAAISSCSSKPGSGGGWVVGNPLMSEDMSQQAAGQSDSGKELEEPCVCKTKKKCDCSNKSK